LRRLIAASAGVLWLTLTTSSLATALCSGIETPAQALTSGRPTFVGVVESLANLDRWAIVHVEEVWSRGDVPEWVEVRGTGIETEKEILSTDHFYRAGQQYLFTVDSQNGHLYDSGCSATVIWRPSLDAARPSTAHPAVAGPKPSGYGPSASTRVLLATGSAAIGLIGVGFVFQRRRRRSSGRDFAVGRE
jgi:hypothetical protein